MAAKLGTADVSFRLGATTPAAVYLGAAQVWTAGPVARTLYWNINSEDEDWSNLDNWFNDSGLESPADSLPSEIDSVVVEGGGMSTGDSPVTVANLLWNSASSLNLSMTVTGLATFLGNNGSTITGDATFNDSSYNGGTVAGNATFNDSSVNFGTVTGTATFTGSACNNGGTAGTFVPDPPPSCPE